MYLQYVFDIAGEQNLCRDIFGSFTFSYFHPLEEQSLGCLYTMSLACLALTTSGEDEL